MALKKTPPYSENADSYVLNAEVFHVCLPLTGKNYLNQFTLDTIT